MGNKHKNRLFQLPSMDANADAPKKTEFYTYVDKLCGTQSKCDSNERFSCDNCDNLRSLIDAGRAHHVPMDQCQSLRDSCCAKWNYTWLVVLLSVLIGLMVLGLLTTLVTAYRRGTHADDGMPMLVPLA